jgi:hypothetical protein
MTALNWIPRTSEPNARRTASVGEIKGLQGKALGVPTDVGNPDSLRSLFAKTKQC